MATANGVYNNPVYNCKYAGLAERVGLIANNGSLSKNSNVTNTTLASYGYVGGKGYGYDAKYATEGVIGPVYQRNNVNTNFTNGVIQPLSGTK